MPKYEYKVVNAPTKGKKGKGVWGAEAKFANAVEVLMNQLGAEGWEYIRSDMLPLEERAGLTKTTTVYKHLLVFRRRTGADTEDFNPRLLASPLAEELLALEAEPEAGFGTEAAEAQDEDEPEERKTLDESAQSEEQADDDAAELELNEDEDENGDESSEEDEEPEKANA